MRYSVAMDAKTAPAPEEATYPAPYRCTPFEFDLTVVAESSQFTYGTAQVVCEGLSTSEVVPEAADLLGCAPRS